jgi:acetylornithine/succinyldiaminopimelate/putrescine aminotransferase
MVSNLFFSFFSFYFFLKTVFKKINKPEFLEHVTEVGKYLRKRIEGLKSPLVKDVRGRGLILGVDLDLAKGSLFFSSSCYLLLFIVIYCYFILMLQLE